MQWDLIIASEEDLDDVLEGRPSSGAPWPQSRNLRFPVGAFGVFVHRTDVRSETNRPLALIARDEDQRKLFGRYSQLRGDLSPISSWCHVLGNRAFENLDGPTREAELSGFQAAWIGLAVAEAVLLSERPVRLLKVAACLATRSFALARTRALWPNLSYDEVIERYDHAQRLLRGGEAPSSSKTKALEAVWEVLWAATVRTKGPIRPTLSGPLEALLALKRAREMGRNEATAIFDALKLPIGFLLTLDELTAEQRVREFDRLLRLIESNPDEQDRNSLLFSAGYLATVAAGGAPSLGLAEDVSQKWPQVSAWAYVLGGIGERVTWTSGFDGLGRLVDRELTRPLRLDEPPLCDFALEEANILVDRSLADPLVHLRVKQSRVITVAIFPGVNVAVPLPDNQQDARAKERGVPRASQRAAVGEPWELLVDALWPAIEARMNAHLGSGDSKPTRRGGKPRPIKRDLLSAADED